MGLHPIVLGAFWMAVLDDSHVPAWWTGFVAGYCYQAVPRSVMRNRMATISLKGEYAKNTRMQFCPTKTF